MQPIVFSALFSDKEVEEFAKLLVRDLEGRFPPARETEPGKEAARRRASAIEAIYARLVKFDRERRLGFFRRARLGNAMRWEMRESGYSESFADELVKGLLIALTSNTGNGGSGRPGR